MQHSAAAFFCIFRMVGGSIFQPTRIRCQLWKMLVTGKRANKMIQVLLKKKKTQIVPGPRYYCSTFTSTVIATAYRQRGSFSKYRFQHWASGTKRNLKKKSEGFFNII
jgi:hypothetical protein